MTTNTDPAAIRAALAAMRGRAEAATRGEWVAMYGNVLLPDDAGTLAFPVHGDEAEIDPENATFIAHARQDVPALLAVAEAAAGLKRTLAPNGDPAAWLIRSVGGWLCVGCRSSADDAHDFPHADDCLGMALDRALAALVAGGEAGEVVTP